MEPLTDEFVRECLVSYGYDYVTFSSGDYGRVDGTRVLRFLVDPEETEVLAVHSILPGRVSASHRELVESFAEEWAQDRSIPMIRVREETDGSDAILVDAIYATPLVGGATRDQVLQVLYLGGLQIEAAFDALEERLGR